jgi:hypothetical protein
VHRWFSEICPTRRQGEFWRRKIRDWRRTCKGRTYDFSWLLSPFRSERCVMYEDEDVWPIRCPHCGHGFTAKIRHLKSGVVTECIGCSNHLGHSRGVLSGAIRREKWQTQPVVGHAQEDGTLFTRSECSPGGPRRPNQTLISSTRGSTSSCLGTRNSA